MTFDKWKWFDAMYADSRFTGAEKSVLGWLAAKAVITGRDNFRMRQSTVAVRTATDARTIRRAYKRARELGYLEIAQSRDRGCAGKADGYRLVIPSTAPQVPDGEVGDILSATQEEVRDNMSARYRSDCPKVEDRANAPTSENTTPISSLQSSLREGAASPLPAPLIGPHGPRCRNHLYVETPPDCRPCGQERERKEAIDKAEVERIEAKRKAIRDAIEKCTECDQYGRHLIDMYDCPRHANFRQKDVA